MTEGGGGYWNLENGNFTVGDPFLAQSHKNVYADQNMFASREYSSHLFSFQYSKILLEDKMNTRCTTSSIPLSPSISEEGYNSPRQQDINSVHLLVVRILIILFIESFDLHMKEAITLE